MCFVGQEGTQVVYRDRGLKWQRAVESLFRDLPPDSFSAVSLQCGDKGLWIEVKCKPGVTSEKLPPSIGGLPLRYTAACGPV